MRATRTAQVFIASPSDVSRERLAAREAVGLAEAAVGDALGLHFVARGWEDVEPGRGDRAQELINPYVDECDLFVGILGTRFGTPSGLAESGTMEEFIRAEERWIKAGGHPEIALYFKRLPQERVADAGPQLQRLLEFRDRVKGETWFREFTDETDLRTQILSLVVGWAHRVPSSWSATDAGLAEDKGTAQALVAAFQSGQAASAAEFAARCSLDEASAGLGLAWLERHGVVDHVAGGTWVPVSGADALVRASQLALSSPDARKYMGSEYFRSGLRDHLGEIVESRQRVTVDGQELGHLRALMQFSADAAAYVLHGDTTPYDNLWDQMHRPSVREVARERTPDYLRQTLMQNVVLKAIQDCFRGTTSEQVEERTVAAYVVRLALSIGFEDHGKILKSQVMAPCIRARTSGPVRRGEAMFAGPELRVRTGSLLLDLEEFDLAISHFDEALGADLQDGARVEALNNKGVALLRMNRPDAAEELFREALTLRPELPHALENLKRAQALRTGSMDE